MYLPCKITLPVEGGEPIQIEGYEVTSGDVVTGYVNMANEPVATVPGMSIIYIDRTPVEDPFAA